MGLPAEDHDALIGRTIAGKFAIESFLGRGAMGSVYKARQTALDKLVALKILHRDLGIDPAFTARFQREAKAASRLDHPNSVRVLDYGEEDGLCYIAMELLDGRTLFKVIHAGGLLAAPRVIDLLRQTLAALAVAHDMGVVHRDLKPENIVVLESPDDEGGMKEVVKVCDFGIAKIIGTRADVSPARSEKLTGQGSVLGTPEYMSPEQARGEPLGPGSDLYSMGVILYELITGQTPFEAETALGILLKHIVEEPKPPSEIQPNVDRHLEAICLKAMQKSPDQRYKSAREMRHALTSALEAAMPMLSTSPMPLTRPVTGAISETRAPITDDGRAPARTAPSLPALKIAEVDSVPMSRPRAAEQLLSIPPPVQSPMRKVIFGSLGIGAMIAVVAMLMRTPPPQTSTTPLPPPSETPAP
ncbi:MAG: protein kinase, partial [Polyangiaceae bacterium]